MIISNNRLFIFYASFLALFCIQCEAFTFEDNLAKKQSCLYEFKINPDLHYSLIHKEDAPCFGYENITYDSCNGRGKYYPGYGLEALSSKFLSNYISSYDINTSYICFKHNNPKHLLKSILFVWYSKLEMPKKIAIYGIQKERGRESEVFLGNISIDQFEELNSYIYSSINLNLEKAYDKYLIRLIKGGSQNRLIVRSIIPDFSDNKQFNDPLLILAANVSKKMVYGYGVHREDILHDGVPCEKTAIRDYILSAKSAHCGNFSYVFVHDLAALYEVTSIGLKSPTGAIHNVVEVYDGVNYKTLDPTLGLSYPCSIPSLIDGSCQYKSAQLLTQINPIFRGSCGINFFYNAAILSKQFNIEQMKVAYCD